MSKARKVAAAEIRAAKKWLEKNKLGEMSPRQFAIAAKTLDKGFKETLRLIASQQTHGVR